MFEAINMVNQLDHLAHLKNSNDGFDWLSQLPKSIERVCAQWRLEIDAGPFLDGTVSYVVPVKQDGVSFVLKLQWPHEECRYEAEALKRWNGNGVVRLLEHSESEHALLLEQCEPGMSLADCERMDRLNVVISLLPRLWVSAEKPFKTLEQEARSWQSHLSANWYAAKKPMNSSVLQIVSLYIDELLEDPVNQCLVHQDLHAGNILSARREPWLVIDPKPLIGEREFSIASVVRCAELGHSKTAVVDRLDRLCAALQLNRERARKWTVVQTFCWALSDGARDSMFDVVEWLIAGESA